MCLRNSALCHTGFTAFLVQVIEARVNLQRPLLVLVNQGMLYKNYQELLFFCRTVNSVIHTATGNGEEHAATGNGEEQQ